MCIFHFPLSYLLDFVFMGFNDGVYWRQKVGRYSASEKAVGPLHQAWSSLVILLVSFFHKQVKASLHLKHRRGRGEWRSLSSLKHEKLTTSFTFMI